jgi:hypothetical protein
MRAAEENPKDREAGSRGLTFPIKLRCTSVADLLSEPGLEAGLARALGRAFARARSVLPAPIAVGGRVVLQTPYLTGSALGGAQASALLARIRRAIESAARAQSLPRAEPAWLGRPRERGSRPAASRYSAREIAEQFDPSRFYSTEGTYELPSYDGSKAKAPVVAVSPGRAGAAPDWASIASRLRQPPSYSLVGDATDVAALGAVYELQPLALAWNTYAIAMLMLGLRADGSGPTWLIMRILRTIARRNARRFRSVLCELRAGYEGKHAAWFERGDEDIIVHPASGVSLADLYQLYEILGGLIYAAREIPEGRPVAAEWEAGAHGLGNFAALLSALAEARAELIRYLVAPLGSPFRQQPPGPPAASATPSFEQTDPAIFDQLRSVAARLVRFQGVTLIQGEDFAYSFQLDLIQNIRWIVTTLDLVQQIDATLQSLRDIYGFASEGAEETKVLREIRADILRDATTPLPTAARANALRTSGETRFSDWIGTAADRRMQNLKTQYAKAATEIEKLVFFADSLRSPIDVKRALRSDIDPIKGQYDSKLTLLKLDAKDLLQEIDPGGRGDRGASYLDSVYHLEKRAALIGARANLLSLWAGAIYAASWVDDQEIGRADDREQWHRETDAIRDWVQAQYDDPDFSMANYDGRLRRLEWVYKNINEVIKRERSRRLLISFGILIITAAVSGGLAAFEVTTTTAVLGEAATVTVLTGVVEPVILGKRIDIGATVTDFITNAATFAAFRILNVGFEAAGELLFPRSAFLRVATTFAGNVAVITAPALLTRLETGQWPDDLASFLTASLLIQTVAGALGARIGRALRELPAAQDLLKVMPDFTSELLSLGDEWSAAVNTGTLDLPKFRSLQTRAAQLAARTEAGLRFLAGPAIEDAELEALQIVPGLKAAEIRTQLNKMAELMSQYGAGVRAAPYPGQVSRLALPLPEAVVPGVTVVAGNTREYNPTALGMEPETVANRLRRAGYTVEPDGAVLRLLTPGEDVPRYLMLPAAPDMPAPALKRLVGAPQSNAARGLRVLQQQSAVPPLEAKLTSIAIDNPETATKLLRGIGRHLSAKDTLAIQGIAHFLDIGGAPKTLAVVLDDGGAASSAEVREALGRFKALTASEAQSLEVIVQTRGTGAAGADSIIGIAALHDAPGPICSALAELAPYTDKEKGLAPLVRALASKAAAERQEGLDALQEARALVTQSTKPRLQFERRTIAGIPRLRARDASVPIKPSPPSHDYNIHHVELLTEADVTRLQQVGVKPEALNRLRTMPIGELQRMGLSPGDITNLAARIVASKARGGAVVDFVNLFHEAPGFEFVVLNWAKGGAARPGTNFVMRYALANFTNHAIRFEWPVGYALTRADEETTMAARYVDVVVDGGTTLRPGEALRVELKAWSDRFFSNPKAGSIITRQLVRDTAFFGTANIRWVFDSSRTTEENVIDAFTKVIKNDAYLRQRWGKSDDEIKAALDEIIEMYPPR